MPQPIAGGSERDREHIEHLIAIGEIPRQAVVAVEDLWRVQLRHGVTMPNGEHVSIALSDLYHLLRDDRVWRKPYRIGELLRNVYQIRSVREDRRRALAIWQEGTGAIFGYAILTEGNHLVTLHIVSEREVRRFGRQGVQLWP